MHVQPEIKKNLNLYIIQMHPRRKEPPMVAEVPALVSAPFPAPLQQMSSNWAP